MSLTRKEFLSSFVTAVAGVTGAAALLGCSDNGGSADAGTPLNCSTNGAVPTIGANHGHMMMVSAADVVAGVDRTYSIMGSATHTHMVTVTAANFTALKNNALAIVTVMSSTEMGTTLHSHTVMISCA
jgi:hypothetical protein